MSKSSLPIKISLIISLMLALAATALPSFAEDATSGGTGRRSLLEQRIQEKKATIQERVAAIKDKVASREADLKAKLAAFKDKRKAETAERVSNNLNKINAKMTEQMLNHLDKMSALLDKVDTRVKNASSSGQNTASASAAVADARVAIASAKAAVGIQAKKDYTINVTSETKVKADAKTSRDNLFKDLQTTRKLVIAAKQAVAKAIRVTAQTLKGLKIGQQ